MSDERDAPKIAKVGTRRSVADGAARKFHVVVPLFDLKDGKQAPSGEWIRYADHNADAPLWSGLRINR